MLGFREEVDKILNDNKKECIDALKIAVKVLDYNFSVLNIEKENIMGYCIVNIHGDIEGDYEIVKELSNEEVAKLADIIDLRIDNVPCSPNSKIKELLLH